MVAALFLGACSNPAPVKRNINLTGFPPAFQDGYADGCHSATAVLRRPRNDVRLAKDTQYANGWRDGFDICGKQKK
ncbi:MAG: hypothetical protein ABI612_16945 [Betaproteobacteria bacterium]